MLFKLYADVVPRNISSPLYFNKTEIGLPRYARGSHPQLNNKILETFKTIFAAYTSHATLTNKISCTCYKTFRGKVEETYYFMYFTYTRGRPAAVANGYGREHNEIIE